MNLDRLEDAELAWLSSLARALIGAPHASDLAQATLVAAIERPAPAGVPRRAWLAGIARRLARRDVRTRARRSERELGRPAPEAPPTPDELLERAEVAAAVSAAVQRLPEPFRRTVLLRYLEGMEPREIADADGVAVDTVRWRLRRGLALLREELEPGRDDMAAFLLPLASAGWRPEASAAAAVGSLPLLSLTLMSKALLTTLASAAVLLAALALARDDEERGGPDLARDDAPAADREAGAPDGGARMTAPAPAVQRVPDPDPAVTPSTIRGGHGVVLDALTREPIPGARVAWLGEDGVIRPETSVTTAEDGSFQVRLDEPAGRLGVASNGHVRRVFEVAGAERPWQITLDRGRVLEGRLLDADRVPVPAVEVLALPAGAGVGHMSPTQRRLRRRSRDDAFDGDPFDACRAVSGVAGDVRFSGLAYGGIEFLSLDPGWAVVGPGEVDAAATYVEWTLESRVGVRVAVVDAAGAPVARRVRSTFLVDVTFEDGSAKPIGQWVGRGEGTISMSLSLADLGDLDGRTPSRLEFHGSATTDTDRAEWRSTPIELDSGWSGVAEATARFEGAAATESPIAPSVAEVPEAELELDVVYTDGAPCTSALNVSWNGRAGRGDVVARRIAPGRYLAELPAKVSRIEVRPRSYQGSIGPWSGAVELDPARRTKVELTLRRGARVTLERPLGFDGTWYVHASWRDAPDAAWRGSWGYGTDEDTLVLEAIETAEWRFTARRQDAPGEDDLVTTIELEEGDDARVGW